jgi:ABC-type multidrug transport system permease subunit
MQRRCWATVSAKTEGPNRMLGQALGGIGWGVIVWAIIVFLILVAYIYLVRFYPRERRRRRPRGRNSV